MPGLNVSVDPLVTSKKPYPTSVAEIASRVQASGLRDVARGLQLLQKSTEDLHRALRDNAPEIHQITVTNRNGDIVARIGELPTHGRILYGGQFVQLYVGDVMGKGDPLDAPFYADPLGHVFIGRNGSIDVLDPYGEDAAWLGTEFDTLPVTGAADNGAGLIRLTVVGHTLATGDMPRVLNVGGVPNATGIFTVTKIDANHIDLQLSVFAGLYTSGGTVDRILHVTGAANNGSGLIRLTVTAHGFETGDQINALNVGGVPGANDQWIVTVISANTFDLQGSTFAGVYTGGGTVVRYAAGGMFENIAIGKSFWDYSLRAFPDGSLKIHNALITLSGSGPGSSTITLDPITGTIIIKSNPPALPLTTTIGANGITLTTGVPHDPGMYLTNNSLQLYADVDGIAVTGPAVLLSPHDINIVDAAGAAKITLNAAGGIFGVTLNISGLAIDSTRHVTSVASIDSVVYKVGGTPGFGVFQTIVESLSFTTGTFITSVNFVAQTTNGAPALTGATFSFKTLTFNSGILINDVP